MRPAFEKTTWLRVSIALGCAFALPSLSLWQVFIWLDETETTPTSLADVLLSPVPSLLFGVFLGWPYVLCAAGVWALLDQMNRHYWWTALITGLLTGVAVSAFSFRNGQFPTHPTAYPIAHPLCIGLGLVTGLCVWMIAYGRQSRLPKPAAPAGRLVL